MLKNKKWFLLSVSLIFIISAYAQENSPFSRYGIGDNFPNQTIQYRGIGGMTAAQGSQQALNTNNPASYSDLYTSGSIGGLATFDLGVGIDSRTLKSVSPAASYNSANFMPYYFSMGLPIAKKGFGLVFGLKPITRINYNVVKHNTLPIQGYPDSIEHYTSVYSGNGGLNQVFLGAGKKIGNLSIGVNLGYDFGKKDIKTQTAYDSAYSTGTDPSQIPTKGSIKDSLNTFGGFVWEAGLQYKAKLSERIDPITKITSTYYLTFGLSGAIKQNIHLKQSGAFYTYYAADANNPQAIDTVYSTPVKKGTATLPLNYNIGVMLNNYSEGIEKWGVGMEYDAKKWASDFRINNVPETAFNNSWILRGGAYFTPDPLRGKSFFSRAKYSLGFYTSKDNFALNNEDYKTNAITLGLGFMIRNFNRLSRQYSLMNTSLEIGRRGGSKNNYTENFFKFSIGFSLSDLWFTKRRYQ